MLGPEEKERLLREWADLMAAGPPRQDSIARFLVGLPPDPEALALVLDRAAVDGAPVRALVEETVGRLAALTAGQAGGPAAPSPPDRPVSGQHAAGPGGHPPKSGRAPPHPADVARVLASDVPYPAKVEVLLSGLRRGDGAELEVVRARIGRERDPFVLATMASYLGQLGSLEDGARLIPLLPSRDGRVVANALEALDRLGLPVPAPTLATLVESADTRVRVHSLMMLSRANPDRVLEAVPALVTVPDPTVRGGVAYLLGEMVGRPRALDALLGMLAREERTQVLKQIGQAIKRHAAVETARALVGRLWEMQGRADGAKLAMLKMLLHEIGIEVGWVQARVEAVGIEYVRTRSGSGTPGEPAPAGGGTAPGWLDVPEDVRSTMDATRRIDVARLLAPGPGPRPPPVSGLEAGCTSTSTQRMDVASVLSTSDAELPLTFTALWGEAAGEARPRPAPAQAPAAPTPASARGIAALALAVGSVATLAVVGLVGSTDPAPSAHRTVTRSQELRARARALNASPARPPSPVPPVDARRPRHGPAAVGGAPRGGPAVRSETPAGEDRGERHALVAEHLGPTGASVDIDGIIVSASAGRVIVRCMGRYYLLRGPRLSGLSVGERIRRQGVLAGVGKSGLIFVDVGAG